MKNLPLNLVSIFLIAFSLSTCQITEENSSWVTWIRENSQEIDLADTSSFKDLEFLKDVLKDRRIVFLGENSHGVSEFNTLKSRLIRYLHNELDFDVIAFESNAGDGFAVNLELPYADGNTAIYNSISTFWHVEENIPLFRYINESHSTNDPLFLAGIDITQSNGSYAFSRFLYRLLKPLDSIYAKEIMNKDSTFSAQGVRKWTIGNILNESQHEVFRNLKEQRLADYTLLKTYIQENRDIIQETRDHDIEVALFYLQSRIDFIHWSNRDSAYMANLLEVAPERKKSVDWLFKQYRERLQSVNLRFIADELYPDKKIIVWAQNTHIEKRNRNRMPFRLSTTDSTYSIGLFGFQGSGCFSFGQGFDGTPPDSMIYKFQTPTDPTSIERILAKSGYNITFVDMKYQRKNKGNSWMFETTKSTGWDGSQMDEIENIRDKWDGLILVKEISPPTYLEFEYDYLKNLEH